MDVEDIVGRKKYHRTHITNPLNPEYLFKDTNG